MTQRKIHRIFLFALLATIAYSSLSALSNEKAWDGEARRRKAAYMFAEAASNTADEGTFTLYVNTIERAHELDPNDPDIAAEYGFYLVGTSDSAAIEQGYKYLFDKFLHDPSDYIFSTLVAQNARQLMKLDDAEKIYKTLDSLYPSKNDAAVALANNYLLKFFTGDSSAFDKSIAIYNRLENAIGNDMGLKSMKIRAYAAINDTANALRELTSLLESAPESSEALIYACDIYHNFGMDSEAMQTITNACQLDSANGLAFARRAELFNELGDSTAFDREVFQALKSTNLEFDTKLKMLQSYIAKLYDDPSQEARIRDLFDVLQQVNPGEYMLHVLYYSYLYTIGDMEGAAEQASFATYLEPSDESLWELLISAYETALNDSMAVATIREAMKRFPDNYKMPLYLAIKLNAENKNAEALEAIEAINTEKVDDASQLSDIYSVKANILSQFKERKDDAYAAYEQSIAAYPESYMSMNNLAYLFAVNGDSLDRAERLSSLAVKSDPENPTYLDTYAWVLFKRGEYSLAKHYIDITLRAYESAAIGRDEDNGEERVTDIYIVDDNYDGEDYYYSSDFDENFSDGVDSLEKVPSRQAPDDVSAEIYEHAGDIYFMNQLPKDALEFWKKALEKDPDNKLLERKVKYKTYFYE